MRRIGNMHVKIDTVDSFWEKSGQRSPQGIDASLPFKDILHILFLGENGCNSIIFVVSRFDLCRPENWYLEFIYHLCDPLLYRSSQQRMIHNVIKEQEPKKKGNNKTFIWRNLLTPKGPLIPQKGQLSRSLQNFSKRN